MPHDRVHVIGTDEQLLKFKLFIESASSVNPMGMVLDSDNVEFTLEQYLLGEKSPYLNKSIRDCGLREATRGLVVGIEREGRRILNPDSTETLQKGDVLWIVGDREKILVLE